MQYIQSICLSKNEKNLAIDLKSMKLFLKIEEEQTQEDQLITSIIRSVSRKFERYTKTILLNTVIDVKYKLSRNNIYKLPYKHSVSIQEIKMFANTGQVTEFPLDNVILKGDVIEFIVHPFFMNMKLSYIAGYGKSSDDIPDEIRSMLMSHVAYLYENRTNPKGFDLSVYDEFKSYNL